MMKTLIFNGSPRKNGDTMALIIKMKEQLHGDVTVVNAYDAGISPCNDCRYCWSNPGCRIQDGMQSVYRAIEEADNIIIASPIYFATLTGQLLSLFSRLQVYYAAKVIRRQPVTLKPKNGVLLLASGGSGGDKRAQEVADIIFKLLNTKRVAVALSMRTDTVPAAAETHAHEEVRIAALKLNSLYKG